ncbi:c-type cytochrome biogenesis protein CcmI [Pontibacter sp. JAM-7]|uniref:c-type cytochrome biogenesis protein CcmI n=1 Tax=Pontibacter sp. JAM-7 TaxID=3366581 RepID=UPI003AF58EE5
MTQLWFAMAVLTVIAMGFVFFPAWRGSRVKETAEDRRHQNVDIFRERLSELEQERDNGNLDNDDFDSLKTELERNLLIDADEPEQAQEAVKLTGATRVTIMLLALLIPAISIGLYADLGRSGDLEQALNDPFDGRQPTMEQAVAELERQLDRNPDNAEGWFLLATSYLNMERYTDAVTALEKVLKILPQDAPQYAGVMGQYAQALYFANGGQMDDTVMQQVEKTLAREPYEITALGLLGISAFEQQEYETAITHWRKALTNADGASQQSLLSGIRSARDRLVELGKPVPDLPELVDAAIPVSVSIADALKASVTPDQTVFVFARPVGGRMPLAAVKLTVADLPVSLVLDDSLAMNPQMTLSSVTEVEVSARISVAGQPQAQPGDMFGVIAPVTVQGQAEPLQLVIDQVVE